VPLNLRELPRRATCLARTATIGCCALSLYAANAAAQQATSLDLGGDVQVGSEAERYVRALQLLGGMPATSWTTRPGTALAPSGSDSTSAVSHPWQARFSQPSAHGRALTFQMLRPRARLVYNSTFAAPMNDGPAWTGRGLTGEFQAGFAAQFSRLHVEVAPLVFLTQNSSFALAPNGETGSGVYHDARFPAGIDAPQRFGANAYGRIDAGNSFAYLDLSRVAIGVSNAAESWGPAREFPLILSGESGGFAHAFAGTEKPINLWLFQLRARVILGVLPQSDFSPIDSGPRNRWASAAVVSMSPRGIPGLEIGATRFIEAALHGNLPTFANVKRLYSGANVDTYANDVAENQLASVFFRWAFAPAGVELYGEYAKDDYALDVRRFLQYPDDLRAYLLGLQHVTRTDALTMRAFHVELLNGELSSSNRGERGSPVDRSLYQPLPLYLHSVVRQGHTNRGLFLGSAEAYGGAAFRTGIDQFTSKGRTSFTLERQLQLDWLPGTIVVPGATHPDVLWSVGAERMRFAGKRDYTVSLTAMFDMNRNLVAGHNVVNLRAAATIRGLR
jgi:hypothetical protein